MKDNYNDIGRTIRHAVNMFSNFLEDATGRPSSAMIYPPKLIYYLLKTYRNKVSYEDRYIKARGDQDLNVEMTIPCVGLKEVDMTEDCPCAPASGCKFFKSIHPLPRMLNGMPTSVTLVMQNKHQKNYGTFTYVDWYNFQDKVNSRIKAQAYQPYYTVQNINSKSHLYIYANTQDYDNIQAVKVSAKFNDPLEVSAFPLCDAEFKILCDPLDEEFLIEDEIQARVFELTFNALTGFRQGSAGVDILNNNNNDTVAQAPM